MTRYRISRFVTSLERAGTVLLCHGPALQRLAVTRDLADALEVFRTGASIDDLAEACDSAATAHRIAELFARHALLVPDGSDEDTLWADQLGLAAPRTVFARESRAPLFDKAAVVTRGDVVAGTAEPLAPLRVALIGGCFVQVLTDFVKKAALRRGFHAEVTYHWPDGAAQVRAAAAAPGELAVLHPFVRTLLEPVWGGHGRGASPAELEARLRVLIAVIESYVGAFADGLAGRLGIVHNLTAPQVSPGGRYDHSFFRLVHRVNDALAAACAAHPNVVLLNEEAIASAIGKQRVLDDLHNAYSHHGHGYTSQVELPRWADTERSAALCAALAEHQLDAYEAWRGRSRIKCVVTDLDDTLWPGVAGDGGIDFARLQYFEGAHEALRLIKARGILLATCSKNDEATALAEWQRLTPAQYLRPDEFVLHRINWQRKSDNLVDIAGRLGLALDAILFVDDNPVEREEVRRALPAVKVWDGEVCDLRSDLLTDARLDPLVVTDESARRTDLMKAQLRRDELRARCAQAGEDSEFLKSLEIHLDVAPASERHAPRVLELVQRTNQFNTSLVRYPPDAVAAHIARGEIWCLHVRDRFADHGLVGAIVLTPDVETMVLSCRVIGLGVAVPFLATALAAARVDGAEPRGTIAIGPRNQPARSVFADAGFTAAGDPGRYVLRRPGDLRRPDPSIYRVRCPRLDDQAAREGAQP